MSVRTKSATLSLGRLRMPSEARRRREMGNFWATRSFQRELIAEVGGAVSRVPVNWGWLPQGGISARGLALGFGGLCDLALGSGAARRPGCDRLRRCLCVDELAEFDRVRHFYRDPMPDFVRDTLRSAVVRHPDIFDRTVLGRLIDDGFGDRRNHATITFALDLALAAQNFL